ncbi:hypothetical protein KOW79_003823 [Hemibagrus wyckioides]|uniref:Uncharacterized protein n=2 Tax=Hemibagrus wyckioides TaxID=337641 RepID=A0A9D3P0N9_9TELE|nr:hypothetical protein KOW79_003823 [Hemibagrus wyckioides]
MQPRSDGVPCDRSCSSTVLWSFSVSQGLHLHDLDQVTGSSPKALRRYDFRLLTPATGGTFHRRGLAASGMSSSSVPQTGRTLMACGKRCVLSLRPERCGNKAENQKAEESEGGASAANGMVDERRKTGEEKKRAWSSVARTRAMVTQDPRPSTAPADTRAGQSDVNAPAPGTHRLVWRTGGKGHSDLLDCSSTRNPVLHLYLPNYPTDPRKEADEELDRQDAETDLKTAEIQIGPKADERNEGKCDVAGGNRTPDVLEDIVTTETGSEQKRKTEECDKRWRGSQNKLAEKEENEQGGVREESPDIAQEPGEEHSTRDEEENSGKSDDIHQHTGDVLEGRPKAPAVKLKSEAAHVRNSEHSSTRRLMLPAPALSIPGTIARTRSSPTPCVLPPFYGSSFGRQIRTPHTSERHRARTHPVRSFSFDKRAIKHPPSLDRTGNRGVFKTEPRGITGSRPKITSCERWGPLPHKTKTTKTFVWGPRGPQESKSVCELHARTNRWRGAD